MSNARQNPRIAILGWGSLIWDKRPEFDEHHEGWLPGGPTLPLEFSRVSEKTRKGALTLVIDPENGRECSVNYAVSTRRDPADAIADLRCREGTVMRRMGFYFADDSDKGVPDVPPTIAPWAAQQNFDVVVWTGLPGDFKEKTGKDFSIPNAVAHLQNLTPEGKAMAATYVFRAPDFIKTPLRDALQVEPWFNTTPQPLASSTKAS